MGHWTPKLRGPREAFEPQGQSENHQRFKPFSWAHHWHQLDIYIYICTLAIARCSNISSTCMWAAFYWNHKGNVLAKEDRMWVFGKCCHYFNFNYTILSMWFMYAWVHSLQSILASCYNHLLLISFKHWILSFKFCILLLATGKWVVDKFSSAYSHFCFCHYRLRSLHNPCFKFYKKMSLNLISITLLV